jgi:hypothetical protein
MRASVEGWLDKYPSFADSGWLAAIVSSASARSPGDIPLFAKSVAA